MKLGVKKERVLRHLAKSPNETDKNIAAKVRCHLSYVRIVRKRMEVENVPLAQELNSTAPKNQPITLTEMRDRLLQKVDPVGALLDKRHNTYGTFTECARISQGIKHYMRANTDWVGLTTDQRESLELIATKLARLLNGDPNWVDGWRDIAGYATLIADRLEGKAR